MDAALEIFFAVDMPDMPDDPFSMEGVTRTEQAAMARFSSAEAVLEPENATVADRFHRYIGEAFVRSFEGRWMNVQVTGEPGEDRSFHGRGFSPVVREPFTESYTDVASMLFMAVCRRTGHEWSSIYAYSEEDHAAWQADAGRHSTKWKLLRQWPEAMRGGVRPE
ncbi:hypothetical protein [Nocardia salmonicida]|uniref:hypothetical protein n=1 Tax=Nocardia salmonicida TaxID=53431 RepID=UPI001042029F|nr:hypothetical protein [Nocardia salmonicida]